MDVTILPEVGSPSPWSSALSGLLAALGSGVLVQGFTWFRARRKAADLEKKEEVEGRSEIALAKMSKDERADQRLVAFLERELSQKHVDLEEMSKERDALQERNRQLAQRWAIQDTNVRILMAAITGAKLPLPFLVYVPDGSEKPSGGELLPPKQE